MASEEENCDNCPSIIHTCQYFLLSTISALQLIVLVIRALLKYTHISVFLGMCNNPTTLYFYCNVINFCVSKELSNHLGKLVIDKCGQCILLYVSVMLCPRNPLYFSPSLLSTLAPGDSNPHRSIR